MDGIPSSEYSSIPAMKPPPGYTTDFEDPSKDGSNATQTIIALSVLISLTFVILAMRLYARMVILKAPGWDDYMAIAATIGSIAYTAVTIYVFTHGYGIHQWNLRLSTEIALLDYLNVLTYLGWPVNLFAKLSLSLLFLRIFGVRKDLRWALYTVIAMNVVQKVIGFFLSIFLCLPGRPSYFSCSGRVSKLNVIIQYFNIVTDFCLLAIPLYGVSRLQMNRRKKLALSLVFLVGLLACLSSILGLYYRIRQDDSPDDSWNFSPEIILVIFEFEATIMVGCFILSPALFRKDHPYSLTTIWARHTQQLQTLIESRFSLHAVTRLESTQSQQSKTSGNNDTVELSFKNNGPEFKCLTDSVQQNQRTLQEDSLP